MKSRKTEKFGDTGEPSLAKIQQATCLEIVNRDWHFIFNRHGHCQSQSRVKDVKTNGTLTNQRDLSLSTINNKWQLLPLTALSHTTSFTGRYITRPSMCLLHHSSSIFMHIVAGGNNIHLVVCHVKSLIDLTLWLCWSGTANVSPCKHPPNLPNNILMRFTSQTRAGWLLKVIFWIFGPLKKHKRKSRSVYQVVWVMLCRADWQS